MLISQFFYEETGFYPDGIWGEGNPPWKM